MTKVIKHKDVRVTPVPELRNVSLDKLTERQIKSLIHSPSISKQLRSLLIKELVWRSI